MNLCMTHLAQGVFDGGSFNFLLLRVVEVFRYGHGRKLYISTADVMISSAIVGVHIGVNMDVLFYLPMGVYFLLSIVFSVNFVSFSYYDNIF